MLTELARDERLVVVTAAGNLAGGGQHDRRPVPAGGSAGFTLLVPGEPTPIHTLWLNLNWKGGEEQVSWQLDGPMGSFPGSPPFEPRLLEIDGGQVEVVGDLSPAGTQMLAFRIEAAPELLPGSWVFISSATRHL
jgi:hypothetical protein